MTIIQGATRRRNTSSRAAASVKTSALLVAVACVVSACSGGWFGEEEVILEGERTQLREVTAPIETGRSAPIPPERPAADWPQVGGAAHRTLGNVGGSTGLQRAWSISIGAGSDSESRVTAPPVASAGRIFALDAASEVTAVSNQGERIWRTDLTPEDEDGRDGFGGGLAVAGERVIAATGFGEVIALNAATGERVWTFAAGAPIRSAPAVGGGLAVVVTRDGVVIAISVQSGEQVWRVIGAEGGAGMMGGGGSAPAISGEVVAAPFATGEIGIMRLRDGRRGWNEPIGGMLRGSAISLISDVTSAPVMAEGRIFAGGVSGRLVAFEIPTGRRVWARDVGAYNPVWVAGSSVFLVSEDARLMALEAASGTTIWETSLPRFEDPEERTGVFAYGGPIMVGGKLILVSTDEKLFRFDGATGQLELEVEMRGPSAIPPIAAGGAIYVLDEDGDLHAYR